MTHSLAVPQGSTAAWLTAPLPQGTNPEGHFWLNQLSYSFPPRSFITVACYFFFLVFLLFLNSLSLPAFSPVTALPVSMLPITWPHFSVVSLVLSCQGRGLETPAPAHAMSVTALSWCFLLSKHFTNSIVMGTERGRQARVRPTLLAGKMRELPHLPA